MSDTKKILRTILVSCALAWLAGCSNEPQPPSVEAFMDDPILLDATMVRCVANRDSVSYDPECVNAREAVERLAAAEEAARRAALEAESERKRQALRRAREAADEARRRAQEMAKQREQAEYLGLVPSSPATGEAAPAPIGGGVPVVTAGDVPAAAPAGAQGAGAVTAEPEPQASGVTAPPPVAAAGDANPVAVPASIGASPTEIVPQAPPAAAAGDTTPVGAPASVDAATGTAPETPPVTTDLGEIRKALEERAPGPEPTESAPDDPAEPPG